MTRQRWWSLAGLVTLITGVVGSIGALTTEVQATATNPYLYPYNQRTTVTFNNNDVTQAWTDWKAAQITSTNAGGSGRLRVLGGVDNTSTVSEGQGYGILFASLFDDQTTLDGLWLFTKDHLDNQGLMHWHIGNPGEIRGSGAATDGDEDIAIGMINACIKVRKSAWSASPKGLDYCKIATDLINAMYTHEVDKAGSSPTGGLSNNTGGELLPGDQWNLSSEYPEGITNLSYFAPGYNTVFGKFTNNASGWANVNTRMYQIVDLAQGKAGNCSKLVSNWNQYDGDPQYVSWQPSNYSWWSYDAARFAWRVAVDRAWYDTAKSRETMNEVGGFFSSVGIANVKAQYKLDGTSVDSFHSPFFVANAAAAIWAAPSPTAVACGAATGTLKTTPQQAYNEVLATKQVPNDYYNNAWRLMSMLLLTGNFPNLYELSTGSTPTATSTSIAQPTSTPTKIATSTPISQPTSTPTKTPTSTPVTQPTSTPSTSASCQVTYTVASQWDNGFNADVTIKNTGAAINGWTLTWSFEGNQQIVNMWNATSTQSGQRVSAKDAGWNGSIPVGGTTTFGFQGSFSGTNTNPTSFSLNGTPCK